MTARVGIIGISHWHAAWYVDAARSQGAIVEAVWDHDPARARAAADALGCAAVRDIAELVDRRPNVVLALPRPIDAVEVMTPVLEAGISTVAEKPMGRDASEVEQLAALADQHQVFTAVMFVNRLSPVWAAVGQDLDHVIAAQFRINNGSIDRYVQSGCGWMLDPRIAGGGCLRNLGIHGADAIATLAAGQQVAVVGARASYDDATGADTYVVALLRFGAAVVVLEAGYSHPAATGSDYEWRISTDRFYVRDHHDVVFLGDASGDRSAAPRPMADRYRAMIVDNVTAALKGGQPSADLWDCYRAAQIVDLVYAALRGEPPSTVSMPRRR